MFYYDRSRITDDTFYLNTRDNRATDATLVQHDCSKKREKERETKKVYLHI